MNSDLRRSLEHKRDETAKKAIQGILAGDKTDIEDSVRKIEGYSRLLSIISANPRKRRLAALAVGTVSILIVWLLWGHKYWDNAISLDVSAETVKASLAGDWRMSESVVLDTALVRIERLNSIAEDQLGIDIHSENKRAWIRIASDRTVLKKLLLDESENIEFEVSGFVADD